MSRPESSDDGMRRVLDAAERAARTSANVLITGESGTGKTRLARWIHETSPRREGPFVEVHCANLAEGVFESELFGHVAGAFTGAVAERPGRFERAHDGTLFLDEVQEIPFALQAKVLRAIQERVFERVGGSQARHADVRIVASTTADPPALVERGLLRVDLLYRLDVVRLAIPPLRRRSSDVAPLAESFLREAVSLHGLGSRRFSPEAVERIARHDWPGNLLELRHAVEAAAVLAEGPEIGPEHLPASLSAGGASMLRAAAAEGRTLAQVEAAYVDEVLRRVRGNKSAAARILGIHRKTLHEKLRQRGGKSR